MKGCRKTKKAGKKDSPKALFLAGLRYDGPPGPRPGCPSTRLPINVVSPNVRSDLGSPTALQQPHYRAQSGERKQDVQAELPAVFVRLVRLPDAFVPNCFCSCRRCQKMIEPLADAGGRRADTAGPCDRFAFQPNFPSRTSRTRLICVHAIGRNHILQARPPPWWGSPDAKAGGHGSAQITG